MTITSAELLRLQKLVAEYEDQLAAYGVRVENDALRIAALTAERDAAQARNHTLEVALDKLRIWTFAYPIEVFPEPDWKRVAEVLDAAGISLDSVSAHNMRHVITEVGKIIDAAMGDSDE